MACAPAIDEAGEKRVTLPSDRHSAGTFRVANTIDFMYVFDFI